MTNSRRERHLNYFKIQLASFAKEVSDLLARQAVDLELLRSQTVFIRGTAMRLRIPLIVAIGKLAEDLCTKISSSPCETEAQRLLVSMDDTLSTILKSLETPSNGPSIELMMLRLRLESQLSSLESN